MCVQFDEETATPPAVLKRGVIIIGLVCLNALPFYCKDGQHKRFFCYAAKKGKLCSIWLVFTIS